MSEHTTTIVINKQLLPDFDVSVEELCKLSTIADMTSLSIEKILDEHLDGYVRVEVAQIEDNEFIPLRAVGYAGYTKDRERYGELFAQVGGVICLPEYTGKGLMEPLIQRILDIELGVDYAGFTAVSNCRSTGLLVSLGMVQVDMVPSESTGILHPLLVKRHGQTSVNTVE